MMYSLGDIVLIKFPFSDLEATKKRPGLVLSSIELSSNVQLSIIAMVTSKLDAASLKGDVTLKSWKDAGLLHPSLVRLGKIATLETEIIEKKIGMITKDDLEEVREKFKIVFKELIN